MDRRRICTWAALVFIRLASWASPFRRGASGPTNTCPPSSLGLPESVPDHRRASPRARRRGSPTVRVRPHPADLIRPDHFGSIQHARSFGGGFFDWYNHQHRHSSLGLITPAAVHYGQAEALCSERQRVLAAYEANPERFVHGPPPPPKLHRAVWINSPDTDEDARKLTTTTVSLGLTSSARRAHAPHGVWTAISGFRGVSRPRGRGAPRGRGP